MGEKHWNNKIGYIIFVLCIAVLFGLVFSLTPVFGENSYEPWNVGHCIIGFVLFFTCFLVLVYLGQKGSAQRDGQKKEISDTVLFFALFVIMVTVGMIYLLIYWPGTGLYDTVYIIQCDGWEVAKQHPWFYCLIISKIVDLVFAMGGGYNIAVPLISFIQIVVSAIIYSYGLIWLRRKYIKRIIWIIIAIIYLFTPIFNMYMITVLKDVPYSLVLFLWTLFIYDIWESDGALLGDKNTLMKAGILLGLSLLRNNGIYVSIFILVGILVCYKKYWRKVILLFGVLVIVIIGNICFEKALDITHLFKETVGIPIQQVAATVYYDGKITDEQENFINDVIDIDYIREYYNPYSADTLKWGGSPIDNDFLNENKTRFLKVWAEMLIPNFKIYVEAYLKNTYSFWSLTNKSYNQIYNTFYVKGFESWYDKENIEIKKVLPMNTQNKLEYVTTSLAKSVGSGILFWVTVLLLVALGYIYGNKIMSIGLPLIGGWITVMISTPVAFQWRYTLYLAIALPIIMGIIFINSEQNVTRKIDK